MMRPPCLVLALIAPAVFAFSVRAQTPPTLAGESAAVSPADYLASLQRAADAGNVKAELNLGAAYAGGGPGVNPDPVEAFRWYRKAADSGDAMGQFMVGNCYEKGFGISPDLAEAARWFQKSAEQNNPLAQMTLGMAYSRGQGVQTNRAEAEKWLTKAAESGHPFPQYVLGLFYWGRPGAKDGDLAATWFHKAADQGQCDAEFLMGECYRLGRGVNKDLAEAYKWESLASRSRPDTKISQTLELDLSPAQKAEGLRRADAFQPHRSKVNIPGMPERLPPANSVQ